MDLSKTTLIIPIKIEHPDRYRNSKTVLNFLNSNLRTNVFIYEVSQDGKTRLDFIKELKNLKIKHWCLPEDSYFHRTRYLNMMLDTVETPVVVNYDIDVILDPSNFLKCQDDILEGKYEVIYPYEFGNSQIMVLPSFDYERFLNSNCDIDLINSSSCINYYSAECGHCIFFDTDFYRKWGGENENFISYGPEDKERMQRFKILTDKITWRPGEKVYHFEHYRGNDSSFNNPHFQNNWKVFNDLSKMSKESLENYYSKPEYSKRYKKIGKSKEWKS